jgi:hypothetical protein
LADHTCEFCQRTDLNRYKWTRTAGQIGQTEHQGNACSMGDRREFVRFIAAMEANQQRDAIAGEVKIRGDGSYEIGGFKALIDARTKTLTFVAPAGRAADARRLRDAFTLTRRDGADVIVVDIPMLLSTDSVRSTAVRSVQDAARGVGRDKTSGQMLRDAAYFGLAGALVFGPVWTGVGVIVDKIMGNAPVSQFVKYAARDVISAGFCAVFHQLFFSVGEALKYLSGGLVVDGEVPAASAIRQLMRSFVNNELFNISVLGGVLAAVAALPKTEDKIANTFRVTGALFAGFAGWGVVSDLVKRVVHRIKSQIHMPTSEVDAQKLHRKLRQAFADDWNVQIRSPRFFRTIVELVAKFMVAVSVPSSFRAMESHTGGSASAGGRALQAFSTNAVFTLSFFAAMRSIGFVFERWAQSYPGSRASGNSGGSGSRSGASPSGHS